MILVWRICKGCGLKFQQWHMPGETGMKDRCPACQNG